MSSIGRLFIILNLVLAAAFVGWAATSLTTASNLRGDHKKKVDELEAKISALEQEKSESVTNLLAEKEAKDVQREKAETSKADADRLTADLEAAKRENSELRGAIEKIQATLEGYNQTNASLAQAKDAATAEARDLENQRDAAIAERDAAVTAQRDAEDALAAANTSIADLERNLTTAKKEVSSLDTKIQTLLAATGASADLLTGALKPIEARVLQVSNDVSPALLAINAGSEQGVTKGMTFQIYSGTTWKGQARVESVLPNMSSAVVTTLKQGENISQGDNAATVL